jgi:Mycobacterial cell wall arabinan synthesis protein/Arabinosyltransferase concanavalin like domain/EmbC C-terminal domain
LLLEARAWLLVPAGYLRGSATPSDYPAQVPVPDTSRDFLPRARWLARTLIPDHSDVRTDASVPLAVGTPSLVPDLKRVGPGQVARWQAGVLAALAALTLITAIGVLLAPVVADDPVVSWPPAGQQPRSTVLPLVPYRPLSLDVRVPCATLAALGQQPEGGDALRTLPASAGKTGTISQGLLVTVHRGIVQISASGRSLVHEALPTPGCAYQVLADAGGVRVLRDGVVRGAASVPIPQVSELTTDLDGQPAATGLAASLHLDARYESTPTVLKLGLLVICIAALPVLLGLAWWWWRGDQSVPIRYPRPRVADGVLVVISGVWVLLAPTNFDDSWYALMARGAHASGSISNAIYMFNVSETPFVASQYLLQAWGSLGGWGLAWLRLLPLIYGLLTWLLLRVLLVTGFGRELDTSRAAYALLVAYLLWWLPYGMTLRPEPLIVLLAAATLLLVELARQRRSVGVLAAATATAALAMSVSPSGVVAAAPLVLALPWLWAWLRDRDTVARVAAVLLLGTAAGASLVLVGAADATLGDGLEATAVHQWYYQAFPWYQEYVHYQTILSFKDSSQWTRRAPVVLTVAVLALVAAGSVRGHMRRPCAGQQAADPLRRLLVSSAGCAALALVLLAPTPTKFVNHFGAVAAAPTVLLAAALLRSPLSWPARPWPVRGWLARPWSPRWGADFRLAIAGTALLVGAVSWSFAGPNIWRPYSDRGQPFGDHLTLAEDRIDPVSVRPKLGPVQLANPLLWVAVALAAIWAVWWWRRRGRDIELTPDRAVLLTGSTAIVAMTVVVFVWAPLRQYPGWSVALSMFRAAAGQSCTLADYAQVLLDSPTQPIPLGSASRYGAFAAPAGLPLPVVPPAPGTLIWQDTVTREVGSDVDGDPDTGSLIKPGGLLVTPWFALPAHGGTALLVPVLGARPGQRLIMEYATAPGPHPAVAGSVTLSVDRTTPETQWQQAAVALDRLGPTRPSSVRLVVHERVSSADSRLAVGQPRLAGWRPLTTLTAAAPVYVDQLTATLLPCLNQVGVEHGIAQAPEVLVLSDEGFGRGFLDLGFELHRGGTQVPVGRSATTIRVPSRLMPNGPATPPWGRVVRVVYDHPVGLVDLHVGQLQRSGWTRLPTLAAKSYHGDST